MEREVKNTNSIFSYALIGSLLFVAALAYTVAHMSNIAMFRPPHMATAVGLGLASLSLLVKAAKDDRDRLREI